MISFSGKSSPHDRICPFPEHQGKQEADAYFLHGDSSHPAVFHRQPKMSFGFGTMRYQRIQIGNE